MFPDHFKNFGRCLIYFSVDLFDTSLYPIEGLDHDEVREKNLSVRKVKDSDKIQLKDSEKFADFFEKVAQKDLK